MPDCKTIHPTVDKIQTNDINVMLAQGEKSAGIIKANRINPLGAMNAEKKLMEIQS